MWGTFSVMTLPHVLTLPKNPVSLRETATVSGTTCTSRRSEEAMKEERLEGRGRSSDSDPFIVPHGDIYRATAAARACKDKIKYKIEFEISKQMHIHNNQVTEPQPVYLNRG